MDPDEDDPLADRIFKDFRHILTLPLDEYAIIPTEEQLVNKCPLVLIDGKLGIESWCLPLLIEHATSRMFRLKSATSTHELNDITRIMLLLNPEFATAWNIRRRLFLQNETDVTDELKFSELLLKRKAKSSDNFSYRQFLLKQLQTSASPIPEAVIRNELHIALHAASNYRRNYYAWSHRIWIMDNLMTLSVTVLKDELQTIENWARTHVSEYSAFHYRQILMLKLKSLSRHNFSECLVSEFVMLDQLFLTFPDRESLFLHRRFLVMLCNSEKDCVIAEEKQFIECQKLVAGKNDWHLLLIQRHEKWLRLLLDNSAPVPTF